MIPSQHQQFIDHAVRVLQSDSRIVGVLGAGSLIASNMDQYSDIDLIVVSSDQEYAPLIQDRPRILQKLGDVISYFTGEHVGEPRVMICLYGNPLLHVDVKFVSLQDMRHRIENPVILFERDEHITQILSSSSPLHPLPDLQWIEDRFWTWIHYAALRIGRGELFEVIDTLGFLRTQVFGPLVLLQTGHLPRGVRRFEQYCPDYVDALKKTIASYDRNSCISGVQGAIDLYRRLSGQFPSSIHRNSRAEEESVRYFNEVSNQLPMSPNGP